MTKRQLHEDCKILSQAVYGNNLGKTINGWECIDAQSYENGYYVEAYKKGNQIIMVSRGTEPGSLKDWYNDYKLAGANMPSQVDSAKDFLKKIQDNAKYKNCDIILTGHSLGGSISQVLGSEKGNETVTFSAYGTNQIPNSDKKYSDNITNYGDIKDPIFATNIKNQIGKTKILNAKLGNDEQVSTVSSLPGNIKGEIELHKMGNWNDLSNNVEYKKPDYTIFGKEKKTPLFKIGIEENVDLSKNNNLNNDYKTNNVLKYSGLDKIQQPLSIEKNNNDSKIQNTQKTINQQINPNQNSQQSNKVFESLINNLPELNTLDSNKNNQTINSFNSPNNYGLNNQFPNNNSISDLIRKQAKQNDGVDISDFSTISRNNSFGSDLDDNIQSNNKKFQDLSLEELLKRLWRFV